MTFNTSESKQADLKQNEFEFRAHIFRSTTFIYAVGPMYLEAATYYSQGIRSASLLSSIGITLTSIFSYVYFRLTKSFDPILIPSLIVKLLLFSFGLYSTGGIFSDQLYYFPLAVLLNGILLGKRGTLFTAGYSVVFTCFLGFWSANGLTVRHETHSPLALSEHVIGTLLFTAWLVYAYEKNRLDGSVRLSNTIGSLTRSEKRHALIQKLDLVLIESENELELAKAAIRELCLELGYVYGNYFTLEAESKRLTLKALWTLNGDDTKAFETISREMGFESGRGLPGRVHKSRKSECIADVVQDKNFPRAQAAEASGLHGAVAFPIYIANEVFGIIEVFSREPASVDPRLLLDLESIGLRIGQVIATFHADLAAKRKENFLGDIIDASPSLIFAKNTHGKYVKVNRAFAQFQNRTKAEIIGKTASDFLANEEVEKRSLIEEQVIAEKKTIVFEEQILTSLGMRWHLTTLFPVLDESGNLLGVGGQHVDIHDQKKLERVHSSMINALNASAIVAMTDERGKITFANDKFTEVTG